MRPRLLASILAALLGGCGGGNDAPVGGIDAEEAAQLNNAAEMLDAEARDPAENAVP